MIIAALLEMIVTAPFGNVYLLLLTKPRCSWKKTAVILGLFTIINIAFDLAIIFFLPAELPEYLVKLLFIGWGWVYTMVISDYKGFRNFFSFLTACTFYEIQSLFTAVFILVSRNQYPYAKIFCETLAFLIIVEILYRFVHKPFLDILKQREIDWKRFCLIPLILTVSFFLLDSYPSPLVERPQNIPAALSLCLTIILYNGMQFFLFRQIQIKFQAVKDVSDMKMQIMALQRQLKAKAESEQKLSDFHYDLQHFANALSVCMANREYGEAKSLLSSIDRTIGEIRPAQVIYCENSIMNAVISMFAQYAQSDGIEVNVRTAFPENFGLNYEELSVVFANAMENAIHACWKIPAGKPKMIRLTCAPEGKQLFIEIANTYAGKVQFDEKKERPVSKKEGHGIGTQSIAAFAERNGGLLLYRTRGDWFYLRLILRPVPSVQNPSGIPPIFPTPL